VLATIAAITISYAPTMLCGAPAFQLALQNKVIPPKSAIALKKITDPCLGNRWLLVLDPLHPERPGQLVLTHLSNVSASERRSSSNPLPIETDSSSASQHVGERFDSQANAPAFAPVIHTGDLLVVDQVTASLHARFSAVALNSAAIGDLLRVRLIPVSLANRNPASGRIVKVVAIGRALARWETSNDDVLAYPKEDNPQQSR
jgi:hypothetical protein